MLFGMQVPVKQPQRSKPTEKMNVHTTARTKNWVHLKFGKRSMVTPFEHLQKRHQHLVFPLAQKLLSFCTHSIIGQGRVTGSDTGASRKSSAVISAVVPQPALDRRSIRAASTYEKHLGGALENLLSYTVGSRRVPGRSSTTPTEIINTIRFRCDTVRRDDVQDVVIVFLKRMTIVCRQRCIRRDICPRDQSQLQTRKSKLSQPLQYTLRQALVLIHNWRNISNSHSSIF